MHKKRNSFIEGPISPAFIADAIAKHQSKTEIGAHHIFLGQVRKDTIQDREVQAIEYTTYKDLAEDIIAEIREAIFAKYEINCMHIHHSLGKIDAGEICFFVFTSSKHRKATMDACEELVERIKKEVPIWGKELFNESSYQWKENK
ncbi:MAG: molybdenum cofactor biosynthesis protein MoaE [Bacteroidota bacterium]